MNVRRKSISWFLSFCMMLSVLVGFGPFEQTLKAENVITVDGSKSDWEGSASLGEGSRAGVAGLDMDLGQLYLTNDQTYLYFWIDTSIPNWGGEGFYLDLAFQVQGQAVGNINNPWACQFEFDEAIAPMYQLNMRISGDEVGYRSVTKAIVEDASRTTSSSYRVILEQDEIAIKGHRETGIEGAISLEALGLSVGDVVKPIVVASGNNGSEHGAFSVIPASFGNVTATGWNESALKNKQSVLANSYTIQASSIKPIDYVSPEVNGREVTFRYLDSEATAVSVVGEFNGWDKELGRMTKNSEGLWEKTITSELDKGEYKFVVFSDDNPEGDYIFDPKNKDTFNNNSVYYLDTYVPDTYKYIIHYYRPLADYEGWNLWVWDDAAINGQKDFNSTLENGFITAEIESTESVVNFIVRLSTEDNEWAAKDVDANRFIKLPDGKEEVEVWLLQGDATVYESVPSLDLLVKSALADAASEITVFFNQKVSVNDLQQLAVKKSTDGEELPVTKVQHGEKSITLKLENGQDLDVQTLYKVVLPNANEVDVVMRNILDDYYYEGDDLGCTYAEESTSFKVWAPTAREVKLILYDAPEEVAGEAISMFRESSGVWSLSKSGDLEGKYYLYEITLPNGEIHAVVDPYAKAVSINGGKSAIINLEATKPIGFDPEYKPTQVNSTDAIIYEMHIRDFSIDEAASFAYPGKFKALTETGKVSAGGKAIGIDHLKALGITHVQIQPMYDFATVDESRYSEEDYNWGYDPQNYNVPEGSYATDATTPSVRILEMKEMVNALHENNIRVIMDVVYNHTFDVTTGPFEKVVPGYYYRSDEEGMYTNGSGCGNEIASERPMVRKYIKDSMKYWATEYGIDGFRMDLMALIDTETVRQIVAELKAIDPSIMVYGEPWSGGASSLASELQTLKGTQKGSDFAVFNDEVRGAIKGDSDGAGTGFATGASNKEKDLVEGISGAIHTIAQNPTEMITYVTAHDNLNLWDKVIKTQGLEKEEGFVRIKDGQLIGGGSVSEAVKNATLHHDVDTENPLENETVKRTLLANGIILTSQGIPFIHAGDEFLRSKYGDSNSYKSSDAINKVNWQDKEDYEEVTRYYEGLIALRKMHPAFRMTTGEEVENHLEAYLAKNKVVAFTLKDYANGDRWNNITVIYNANETEQTVALPHVANWKVVVDEKQAGCKVIRTLEKSASVSVAPLSMMVLYDEGKEYEQVPTEITLTPSLLGLEKGTSKKIVAVVKDQMGSILNTEVVKWASSDESKATVSANGKITAVGLGEVTITASVGEISCEAKVNIVEKLVPTTLTLSASRDYVYEGFSMQLQVEVRDQFKQVILMPKVNYTSENTGKATVSSGGKVTGISEGSVNISANCGEAKGNFALYVKPYEKRYVVLEYTRPDGDYSDWNIWLWDSGIKDGQIDFEVYEDGKAIAYIEVGPSTTQIGYILRKGTNWDTAKQDITDDRFIYTPVDQTIVKTKVVSMVKDTETLAYYKAPQIRPEENTIAFSYRDNKLFKVGKSSEIKGVEVEINGTLYPMTYDAYHEIFSYIYQGLESGKYYYRYHVTFANGTKEILRDPLNNKVENGQSVLSYERLSLAVTAYLTRDKMSFRESTCVEVVVEAVGEDAGKTFELDEITINLESMGGKKEVVIDQNLKTLTLTATHDTSIGAKILPIKVKDSFGNVYQTEVTLEIVEAEDKDHFDWDEAVIYFMLTDRFNNGDKSNDDPLGIGYDETDRGAYQGGDLKGVTQKLDYLKDLGVNTVWITPIVANVDFNVLAYGNNYETNPDEVGADVSYYAYHGYWAKDFTKLNPHLGTLEDLHELIDQAHTRDMKIMVDIVINHAGYGMKEDDDSNVPYFPSAEEKEKFSGMLRTDGSTDTVYGELAGLPDFITENEEVRNRLINWQVNWVEELAKTSKGNTIDYFRIDTAKHVDQATLMALKNELVKVKPDFRYIAEAWLSNEAVEAYLNSGMADAVLNFDFKEIANSFLNGNLENAEASLERLNEKATSAATYGNFLGSHDEDGFLYKRGMENIEDLKVAATLQMTSKGQPVIYYGEEIGLSGKNNWPYYENRYNMDWSKVNSSNSILTHYKQLLAIRNAYSEVFARGTRSKVAGSDKEGYMAFERSYQGKTLIVAVNNEATLKEISLQVGCKQGTVIKDLYSGQSYTVGVGGHLTCKLPSSKEGGTLILTIEEVLPVETPTPTIIPTIAPTVAPTSAPTSGGGESNTQKKVSVTKVVGAVLEKLQEVMKQYKEVSVCGDFMFISIPVQKQLTKVLFKSDKVLEGVTAVVRIEEDGTLTPVPSKIVTKDGITELTLLVYTSGHYVAIKGEVPEFDDIKEDAWYTEAILFSYQAQLLKGMSEKLFSPHTMLTQVQLQAIVLRLLGIAPHKSEGTWYQGIQESAEENGFVFTKVEPHQEVTRGETMAILRKALEKAGYEGALKEEEVTVLLASYKDLEGLTQEEQENAAWCIKAGLFVGINHEQLAYEKGLSRAQMAVILKKVSMLIVD